MNLRDPRSPAPPRVRPAEVVRLALAILFFTAAPTAGDIGSSCQAEDELEPVAFFNAKQDVDCARCDECGIVTDACLAACSATLVVSDFPAGCAPLVHDGNVCIDALQAASCGDYASFMADQGATIPTECDFCPASRRNP